MMNSTKLFRVILDDGWYSHHTIAQLWFSFRYFDEECLSVHGTPEMNEMINNKLNNFKELMKHKFYQPLRQIFRVFAITSLNEPKITIEYIPSIQSKYKVIMYREGITFGFINHKLSDLPNTNPNITMINNLKNKYTVDFILIRMI